MIEYSKENSPRSITESDLLMIARSEAERAIEILKNENRDLTSDDWVLLRESGFSIDYDVCFDRLVERFVKILAREYEIIPAEHHRLPI